MTRFTPPKRKPSDKIQTQGHCQEGSGEAEGWEMNAQPKDKTEIVLAMWRGGADTTDIAQRTRIAEHLVYTIIAHRPRTVRPSLKIPYAGAPQ